MTTRMFRIDPTSKSVDELRPTTFSDAGLLSTQDIHDWLASHPGLLGENLLIIQQQHQDVNGSQGRPALLALDRDGTLAIVEANRDDSGSDHYWQAALYAASYWARSAADVVDLYAAFAKIDSSESIQRLVIHTGSEDEQDLLKKLNNRQRLVLVARNFPREVTTTVLWLNEQGLDVSCLQLTPHSDQDQAYYIQSSYIIPIHETKDLMDELRRTQQERKAQEADVASRQDDEVSRFMNRVRAELLDQLPLELRPDSWSRWAGQSYSTRYYKYWRKQWPWRNHDFCFATELETDEEMPHHGEVSVRFFVDATYLRGEGISEEAINRLRQLISEVGRNKELDARQHEDSLLLSKWVSSEGLSDAGVSAVAESLPRLVEEMIPRIQGVLDDIENESNDGVVSPLIMETENEVALDGASPAS